MREIPCIDGGTMIEVYRAEGWGQVNVRTLPPGGNAGGHRHPRTDEWWMLLRGSLRVVLERPGSEPWVHHMHKGEALPVAAGTGHAVENVGDEEAVLLFWRSRLYDPDHVDKEPWTT